MIKIWDRAATTEGNFEPLDREPLPLATSFPTTPA